MASVRTLLDVMHHSSDNRFFLGGRMLKTANGTHETKNRPIGLAHLGPVALLSVVLPLIQLWAYLSVCHHAMSVTCSPMTSSCTSTNYWTDAWRWQVRAMFCRSDRPSISSVRRLRHMTSTPMHIVPSAVESYGTGWTLPGARLAEGRLEGRLSSTAGAHFSSDPSCMSYATGSITTGISQWILTS